MLAFLFTSYFLCKYFFSVTVSKITFTIGPIRQEDFSLPELNRIIALAGKFTIDFDTVTILDTEEKDRLG